MDTAQRQALMALDTPTICNALEVVDPSRRARGFNIKPLVCAQPKLAPMVGYARTARIRAQHPPTTPVDNLGYYQYIAEGGEIPSVVVVEDIDPIPGFGALWGEVNTNVHFGLGCLGVVTNGSIRDLPDAQPKFQMLAGMVNPSHAYVHVVDWGNPVTVHGMEVSEHDLIHADLHGAVVIPAATIDDVLTEAARIIKRERVLISAAQQDGFNIESIKAAYREMADIH
ncbi:MAG: RraA family protein [Pseudomonadales bacterium]|nr:RraA family protein [Pseudomonadales bacterium]MDA0762697.1 RraA family protein [Pseudomonadota bacterium]MDA1207597.1 RraA family protein [Pseudomonadota bacterium]